MDALLRYLLISGLLLGGIDPRRSGRAVDDSVPADAPAYHWTKAVERGPWKKSYNFQMFSLRDTLWVFHSDGTWFSVDGKQWQKSPLPNAIANLAFLDYVPFNGAVLGLGHFDGNSERYTLRPAIYQTRNLVHWQVLARESNLPRRFFYHPFVFQDKLWLIGGENDQTQFADVWNSADGVYWQKQKDNLPFGKRSGSQVVTLRNRLYLLNNDVWSSVDGMTWKQETAEIVKGMAIFGYAAVVLDEQIWLLGCNRNGQFTSNVLVSSDGRTWRNSPAPWSPRGGIAACVHRGRIYMTGGKYGGQNPSHPNFVYSNDVWTLSRN